MNILALMAVKRFKMMSALICLIILGCSSGDPKLKKVYPAKGTLTFRGQPAEGIQLNFSPLSGGEVGMDTTFPTATSGSGGKFQLNTYRQGDGAPAGEYVVTAFWPDRRPSAKKVKAAAGEEIMADRFNGEYSNPKTSKLRVTISEKENDITLDIP